MRGQMSDNLTKGMIILLFKKGDKTKLYNYRPLTMLNTDYKILTKILANRVKYVIKDIISSTQAYALPGRDISDTLMSIRDTIHFFKNSRNGGVVLNLDLNKTFDRVNHTFLKETMKKFGFGPKFLNWINVIYDNPKSCIKINGVLTDTIHLKRISKARMSSICNFICINSRANSCIS